MQYPASGSLQSLEGLKQTIEIERRKKRKQRSQNCTQDGFSPWSTDVELTMASRGKATAGVVVLRGLVCTRAHKQTVTPKRTKNRTNERTNQLTKKYSQESERSTCSVWECGGPFGRSASLGVQLKLRHGDKYSDWLRGLSLYA